MPLTKTGKKVLNKFKKEYGMVKGEKLFYAYSNLHPIKAKKFHRK